MTDTAPQRCREGVWAKIIRAEEHLAAIRAEVALFSESDPYELVGEFDAEGAEYRARLLLCEAPSIRLQLLIGDFAYNLRSALDHLAWWLVTRNGGTPQRNTAFPIKTTDVAKSGKPAPAKIHPAVLNRRLV